MAVSIGPKIGVDGEADYREQMSRVISKTQALKAEMTALKTAVTDEATAEENARAIAANHEEQIRTQEERVKLLTEQLQRCKEKTGENSTETNKYREQLANAQTVLNQMRNETDQAADATDDLADAEEDAGDNALTMGEMIKANVISEAIISGLKKLAELAWDAAKALVSCASDAAQYADDVLTMSTVTGLTTQQIQEFSYMADLVDVSLGTMTGSMTKLTRTMQNARKGNKDSIAAFENLGVNVTNADGSLRDSTEVFFDVIDALGAMEEGTERDALAMEIFGKSAQELNPLIAAGSSAIENFRREAHQMGYVLGDDTLGSLGALSDAYAHLSLLQTTVRNRLGAAMAPAMERVLSKLVEFSERIDWEALGDKLGTAIENGADKLIALLENIDIDKAAQGAMTLVEGLITGLGWILEHADEIVSLVTKLGAALLTVKGVGAVKSGWGTLSSLVSGGAKAGGTAAGATGAGIAGGSSILSTAGTVLAGSPLALLFGAFGFGVYDSISAGRRGREAAAAAEGQSIEELTARYAALNEEIEKLQKDYDEALIGDTYSADGTDYGSYEKGLQLKELKAEREGLEALIADAEAAGDTVTTTMTNLSGEAAGWGSDMMASMADGVAAGANSSLIPTITSVAAAIAALLHHSEPDVGPLANDSEWMPDLMSSMAEGIRANKGLVLGEMNALAADMGALMPTGGGTTMNYGGVTVVFQVQDGQTGRDLFDQFSDYLANAVYREGAVYG